jgi:hypothetical protein
MSADYAAAEKQARAEQQAATGAAGARGNAADPAGREAQGNAGRPPTIVSMRRFIEGFKPPQYEIDGLLRRGCIYTLTGPTGHGKTAVALCLEMHMALGRWLGGREVEQGTALYFAAENPDDTKARVILIAERLSLNADNVPLHFVEGGFSIHDWMDHIRRQVEALGGVSSLTIDTGPSFQVACGFSDENDNMQALRFALMLREFTKLPGNPVVLVPTHPVKNAGKENLIPRGGSAFLNEMDGGLTQWAEDERAFTELHWAGKLRAPAFDPITFALEKGTCSGLVDHKGRPIPSVWAFLADQRRVEQEVSRHTDDEDMLLVVMHQAPTHTLATWAEKLGWFSDKPDAEGRPVPLKPRVHRTLKRLEEGRLAKQIRRRWTLTKTGKTEAERLEEQAR